MNLRNMVAISDHESDVCHRAGRSGDKQEGEQTVTSNDLFTVEGRMKAVVEWKLESEVEDLRKAMVRRARSLAEDLTRLADGLEADPNHSFNTLGILQGNGVELDAWCVKLGFVRDTLKMFRQAMREEGDDAGRA
jgi:hypothetical protein